MPPLLPWMQYLLRFAGIYNVLLGLNMVLLPGRTFETFQLPLPDLLLFVQLVGILVAVFGVGYLMVARQPLRHRGVLLLGLLGKALVAVLGVAYVAQGKLPPIYLLVVLFSDAIYLVPFALILARLNRVAAEQFD